MKTVSFKGTISDKPKMHFKRQLFSAVSAVLPQRLSVPAAAITSKYSLHHPEHLHDREQPPRLLLELQPRFHLLNCRLPTASA